VFLTKTKWKKLAGKKSKKKLMENREDEMDNNKGEGVSELFVGNLLL
jgi:hypothetical protein